MTTISQLTSTYSKKIDYLDIEIIISNSLAKTREFVLAHPEHKLTAAQCNKIKKLLERRIKHEPIAQIIGHKEFFGLDFIVNKYTLIPRPETEMMVEAAMQESRIRNHESCTIIDVGTGSGCIIISIAKAMENFKFQISNFKLIGTDISLEALKIAKKNAKNHSAEVKFLESDLLSAFLQDTRYKIQDTNLIITANLPYLSKEIYESTTIDVKKYEPKSALYSAKAGLAHYERLLKQLQKLLVASYELRVTLFLEISPEQKNLITKLIKSIFPKAKIEISKDLAGKWRVCKVGINILPPLG